MNSSFIFCSLNALQTFTTIKKGKIIFANSKKGRVSVSHSLTVGIGALIPFYAQTREHLFPGDDKIGPLNLCGRFFTPSENKNIRHVFSE